MPDSTSVLVCDVQRFSIHDGPGIRTTVFFKGCPLSCRWCHNPETISFKNQIVYSASECIGCGDCVSVCPHGAVRMTARGVETDFSRCTTCLACTDVCPGGARKAAATRYDADTLLEEVLRDADFYGEDGGITLSGGEPLVHPVFQSSFLTKAKQAGLHVIAETAGYWSYRRLRQVLDNIDLVYFDLKVIDEKRHRQLVGRSNAKILENLRRLAKDGRDVVVRLPLIPGLNDDEENLRQTAQIVVSLGLSSIVLLKYHPLGESKLVKMDTPIEPLGLKPMSDEQMRAAVAVFESHGLEVRQA